MFRLQSVLCKSLWKGCAQPERTVSLYPFTCALPTAPFALANPFQTHPQDKLLQPTKVARSFLAPDCTCVSMTLNMFGYPGSGFFKRILC
jgi:hypothetical protein